MALNTTNTETTDWDYCCEEMRYALSLTGIKVLENEQEKSEMEQFVFELQVDEPKESSGANRNIESGVMEFIVFYPYKEQKGSPASNRVRKINARADAVLKKGLDIYAPSQRPSLTIQSTSNVVGYELRVTKIVRGKGFNTISGFYRYLALHYNRYY